MCSLSPTKYAADASAPRRRAAETSNENDSTVPPLTTANSRPPSIEATGSDDQPVRTPPGSTIAVEHAECATYGEPSSAVVITVEPSATPAPNDVPATAGPPTAMCSITGPGTATRPISMNNKTVSIGSIPSPPSASGTIAPSTPMSPNARHNTGEKPVPESHTARRAEAGNSFDSNVRRAAAKLRWSLEKAKCISNTLGQIEDTIGDDVALNFVAAGINRA